jgi:hypothetical protein
VRNAVSFLLFATLACTGASGDSSSSGGTSGGSGSTTLSNDDACREIIEACHYKDDGTDPTISGCHGVAHEGGECLAQLDACVAYCEAAPPLGTGTSGGSGSGTASGTGTGSGGSGGGSAGSTGGGSAGSTGGGSAGSTGSGSTSGGNAGCTAYCTCMSGTCAGEAGYPWTDEAACLAACEQFTTAEFTCWDMWCYEASLGGAVDHLCEHAWGANGLDEC